MVAAKVPTRRPWRRLSAGDERALAARIRSGDRAALHELVEANLPFARQMALRYCRAGYAVEDLAQEGNLGLMEAASRFDPESHPVRFATYARYWVRNFIRLAMARDFPAGRVPDYMFRLRTRVHRDPAAAAGLTPRQRSNLGGIPAVWHGVDPARLCGDGEEGPAEVFAGLEEAAALAAAIDGLGPFGAWVIRGRFGIGGGECLPYHELARLGATSVNTVRRVEWRALDRLRDLLGARDA